MAPLRTFHDKRLAYLVSLENSYKELGYSTRLNGRDNILEIFKPGTVLQQPVKQELIIEHWID